MPKGWAISRFFGAVHRGWLRPARPQVKTSTGFPHRIANVQVIFKGTPGPLLYVQDSQIDAIVPWSLQPGHQAQVCVVYVHVFAYRTEQRILYLCSAVGALAPTNRFIL